MTNFPPLTPDAAPVPQARNARLNLTDVRRLTMGEGGIIRTAASGQRIELTNEDRNYIRFYSGDILEASVARIVESTNGSGTTRTIQLQIVSPYLDEDDQGIEMNVRSGSPDGTSFAPGIVFALPSPPGLGTGPDPEIRIQNNIPLLTDGDISLAAGGSVGFGSSYDDAIHQTSDGVLEVEIGGTSVAAVNSLGIDATGGLTLPVKATTGDPSGISTGYIYMNTFDKAIRAYDGATWRDVVTW